MIAGLHDRLRALGLALPPPPPPRGVYVPVVRHGALAYVSGQVSRRDGAVLAGTAIDGAPRALAEAAAEACVLNAMSALSASLRPGEVLERIVFLRGFIQAGAGFTTHSAFLDPASELLHALFGERGRHARSALGVASLPGGGLLEIELVAALHPPPA